MDRGRLLRPSDDALRLTSAASNSATNAPTPGVFNTAACIRVDLDSIGFDLQRDLIVVGNFENLVAGAKPNTTGDLPTGTCM